MSEPQILTAEQELREAREAQSVLDSPIFQKACRGIEDGLAAQRRAVPMRDTDMHSRLIMAEQLWGSVMDFLRQTVQTGDLAQLELRRRESARDRVRQMFSGNLRG